MKKHLYIVALILISVLPLFDLLKPGLPQTHDGVDHVARIANFYLSIKEGNLIPRWAANLNWGYGHPILMFLYPFPSYLASLIHFFGASLVDSTKLVFAIGLTASGMSMYIFLSAFMSKRAAFLGALVYMFSPYRFVDLYVRGAIGEHVAFIFPPLICYALYLLAYSKFRLALLLGWASIAGLLLSHNAISLMFLPIFGLYGIYLLCVVEKRWTFLFHVTTIFIGGFALAAFFWVPAFFEGKYTLRDIVTKNEYMARFETWNRFIYSPWSFGGTGEFSVQVGIVSWIGILLLPLAGVLYYRKKNRLWQVSFGIFALFFMTLFLMTKGSEAIWQVVTILQKFQFPWRLLSVIVFLGSLATALVIQSVSGKRGAGLFLLFSATIILSASSNWYSKGHVIYPESFYSGIYNGTTDTGESSPIWSVRFMEKRPKSLTEVIEGNALIQIGGRITTEHKYMINASSRSRVLENTLYFPGWEVSVNGVPSSIEFQDPRYRGLITYTVSEGKNNVIVFFRETRLRLVSDLISVGMFVLILFYAVYLSLKKLWRRYQ